LNLFNYAQEQLNEYRRTVREIRRLGVLHCNPYWSNVLWNSQLDRVQLVGFHKAKLLPKLPGKRKRIAPDDRLCLTFRAFEIA